MTTPEPIAQDAAACAAGLRPRVAVQWSIEGDLRFLAHRDQMRLLARALRRAGWPLAFSEGFNPQPRISLPLPRPVGLASAAELAIIELSQPWSARRLFESLELQLPAGCRLHRVLCPAPRRAPHARAVEWDLPILHDQAELVQRRIDDVLCAPALLVQRIRHADQRAAELDVRPYIERMSLHQGTLRTRLVVRDQQSLRTTELLELLHLPRDVYGHRLRRVRVEWDIPLAADDVWPRDLERNDLDHQEDNDKVHTPPENG